MYETVVTLGNRRYGRLILATARLRVFKLQRSLFLLSMSLVKTYAVMTKNEKLQTAMNAAGKR